MEKITFVVTPDFKEENANSFGLTAFENTEIYKDDKQEYEYVSLKKYIDLENIVCTKTGLVYRPSNLPSASLPSRRDGF